MSLLSSGPDKYFTNVGIKEDENFMFVKCVAMAKLCGMIIFKIHDSSRVISVLFFSITFQDMFMLFVDVTDVTGMDHDNK